MLVRLYHTHRLVLGFLLLAPAGLSQAQVVTTDPAFPTLGQALTIFFHADEGNQGLQGFSGDVYAHTGVITENSSNPSDWKYVVADWRDTGSKAQMTRVGPDLYRLDIADVRAYYGVPENEDIEQIALVFWGVNGGEGKDTGGEDIFVDLFSTGVFARINAPAVSPLRPLIAARDTTVTVEVLGNAEGSTLTNLRLLQNGTEVASTTNDTLTYELTLDMPGVRVDLLAIAENDGGQADTAAFYAVRNPAVVDAARPAGTHDGINLDPSDGTTATFSFYGPEKAFAYLIGDFNDWEIDPQYFMQREAISADSVHWWTTVTGLTPGTAYAFQYFVDGQIRVADPYAETILDPFNDPFIGADTYPDLPPYPAGETEQMVSLFEAGQQPYVWTATDYERPPQGELVIYELLLRDFLADHDFETLIDTLDYLDRLGINAIELMPISEFDGNDSWGYNPAFHLAVDKYYGPADDFKRFVDEAHKRDIAVILDVVYNHATGQSPLIRLYNQSTTGDPGALPAADSPFANTTARHPFNVFNDLNHESAALQGWLDRANRHWLTEYNVDGFRFDLSKGFTQRNTGNDVGLWSSYDASRVALLKRMADTIWATDPTAYVILEHFADNSEEKELAEYGTGEGKPGMMLWGNLNHPYNEATMGYHGGGKSDFSWGYYENRGWAVPNLVTYMESHDEQWMMFKNIAFGACSNAPNGGGTCATNPGAYNVRHFPIAYDRMKMAGAFFFTIPGPKMMWQFGELGYGYGPDGRECLRPGDELGDCPSGTAGRTGRKPIRWEYRDDVLREKLYKAWSALINLRQAHEVFRSTDTQVTLDVGGALKRIKLSHPSMNVVIIGNFGVTEGQISPEFFHPGTWYDFFPGEEITVTNTNEEMTLLPGEFHVYTNQLVDFPEPGLITVDVEDAPVSTLPQTLALHANYPNPFNPTTTFAYSLPQAGPVRLAVYDALGREVALLHDGPRTAGTHTAVFDASALASGVYLYRLEAAGQVRTRTMLLVK